MMMVFMRNVYDGDDDAEAGGCAHNTKVMGTSMMTLMVMIICLVLFYMFH